MPTEPATTQEPPIPTCQYCKIDLELVHSQQSTYITNLVIPPAEIKFNIRSYRCSRCRNTIKTSDMNRLMVACCNQFWEKHTRQACCGDTLEATKTAIGDIIDNLGPEQGDDPQFRLCLVAWLVGDLPEMLEENVLNNPFDR